MGMETLNSAARAAGFAMAAADEPDDQIKVEARPEQTRQWRSAHPLYAVKPKAFRPGDWVKGFAGFFGWRAPASPA